MEKKAIERLEELYKDEINSHDLKKAINNVDIKSLKVNKIPEKMRLSIKNINNNSQNAPIIRNTLIFKNKLKNINLFQAKEKMDNLFTYSNSEDSKKEEEKIANSKFKKRNNITLKICKTFKNCDEKLNNAKLLFFNKGNKHSIKPSKKYSTKNWLSSNKRGTAFIHITKKHKKIKDSPYKYDIDDYIIKKKNTICKTSNSNNGLLFFNKNNIISDFKEERNDNYKASINNRNSIVELNRKRAKSNYIKNIITNPKRKYTSGEKSKKDTITDKYRNSNKNNIQIVYDTDNEVENNILCLLDKSFKKKNTMVNAKKRKYYGTQEILNGNYFKYLTNSLECKNNESIEKSNDIGKIDNFESISMIKKTELNHWNYDDDLIQENGDNNKNKLYNISSHKASFEMKDSENNNFIMSSNKSRNKKKKKLNINYNNKMTQKEDDINLNLENKKKNENIIDDDKNNTMNNNKNSINNNNFSKGGCISLFKCCFLVE